MDKPNSEFFIGFLMKPTLLLPTFAALLALNNPATAQETAFADIGKIEPMKFAAEKMQIEITGDGVKLTAPDFWSCGIQIASARIPQPLEHGKFLKISASGSVPLDEPMLVLNLRSANWQRADVYNIPISGLDFSAAAQFTATSPLGEPVEKLEGGLEPGEQPAHLQLLLKGKGKSAVEIVLEKLETGER